ncbi:DUF1684 domain-containing protein [Brachybacterium sp. ACRRE]|uniref:DUF1684 domain-containing protein n=1 Tax=Brachybacterium sp. ACRRE TaxID=2918184 RepID=UPI001EF30F1A|nr:DUF1684 domain-containing protein [Brachybacterium sp. ACRRE]MCG7309079.1 DUF1684 domain-containing protein [Brachybacterium sp. ACRRE]
MSAARETAATGAFTAEWTAWHEAHERSRTDPLGILAATGLHWLGRTRLRAPGVPGAWSVGPQGPLVELAEGEVLTAGGEELRGTRQLAPFMHDGTVLLHFVDRASGASGASGAPGTSEHGVDGVAEVARRGSGVMLRPRRADSPYLASFTGTKAYPADPQWAIDARFVADSAPTTRRVDAVLPGIQHSFSSPGRLEFERDGRTHRLTAFAGADGALTVLFRDATSGITTYAASRSLTVPAPSADGSAVLDFNRAVNLPCAYTDFSTCPVPPRENTLPFCVDAGEKVPAARASAA